MCELIEVCYDEWPEESELRRMDSAEPILVNFSL